MLEESSEPLSTTPEEAAPSSKSISETPININTTPSTSSPLKEPTPDNICLQAEKPPSPPATSSPSTESPKVPPSATSNPQSVTRAPTPDAQEPTPPSLDTPMTAAEPESDSPQVPEKPSPATAEPPLVSSPVEVETKSPSWRLVPCSTSSRDLERDSPEWEVWEWTPLTIPTEVVTTSTWVSQAQSADSPHQVKRSVSSPPEELVSSEVLKPLRTCPKKSDSNSYLNFYSILLPITKLNTWFDHIIP